MQSRAETDSLIYFNGIRLDVNLRGVGLPDRQRKAYRGRLKDVFFATVPYSHWPSKGALKGGDFHAKSQAERRDLLGRDTMLGCYSSQEYHADQKLLDSAIESGYVCATSSRFEALREVQTPRWSSVSLVRPFQLVGRSNPPLTVAALLALLLVMPVAALAQGSPFDAGFTAIQSPFIGYIAKLASLVAIVIGGYAFAHGRDFQRLNDAHFCCQSGWFFPLVPVLG
jgi:hypothetical protein